MDDEIRIDAAWEDEESGKLAGGSQEARILTCSRCHGDGICYHCDGEAFQDGRRCRVCEGTGQCTRCQGAGGLEVFEINGQDYTVCGSCQGSGDCGICDGSGKKYYTFSTLGTAGGDCSLCHGSGNCLECKGSGMSRVRGF